MTTGTPAPTPADPVLAKVADPLDALNHSVAPMPTAATLRMRRSVPAQLVRFGAINLKMLRIAMKSHK